MSEHIQPMSAVAAGQHVEHAEREADSLLELVTPAPASLEQRLSSGRTYAVVAGVDADRVTIRGVHGQVVLTIDVTEQGPVLRFDSAAIELTGERISLRSDRLEIATRGAAEIDIGGTLHERVGGDRHSQVAGAARTEAAEVELQANDGRIAMRAMRSIHLDGEHIGLNDDPCPHPFDWSAIAQGDG